MIAVEITTDLEFMAAVRPDLERIWAITLRLEAMYREWNAIESHEWRRAMVPTAAFPVRFERHVDMAGNFDDGTLKARIASTADLMEAYAVLAFHRAATALPRAAPGEDEKINACAVSLDPDRWEADGLLGGEGLSLAEARKTPAAGMENLFMEAIATGGPRASPPARGIRARLSRRPTSGRGLGPAGKGPMLVRYFAVARSFSARFRSRLARLCSSYSRWASASASGS